MSRIVVAVEGEVTMRAAQSLVVDPGVDEVALLAPTTSSHFPTVDTPLGWDVVVGSERAAQVGQKHGIAVAVIGDLTDQPGVSLGSPVGLTLALAVGVDHLDIVAVALPGTPEGDVTVVFPSPIDARRAVVERHDGHDVLVARGEGPLAAALVLGSDRHRVVMDDHQFLAGIALGAAAVIALEELLDGPTPAWTRAEDYLRAAVEMGLVIGERSGVA